MNSLNTGLDTNKSYKFINLFNRNGVGSKLPAIVLLSVISSQAFANRPSMEEPQAAMDETSEAINEPVKALSHRPAEEAPHASMDTAPMDSMSTDSAASETSPSSVDLIMQQQNQQTRGMSHLPAKEIQPGETIRINALDFPRRGMSMDKVKNEYGQPIAMSNSVGNPPITRWTYRDRIVYFERSLVIHAVAR